MIPTQATAALQEVNTKRLRDAVTVNGILQHERAFQRIANNNGGTRASGTPGYDASAAYVRDRLEDAGYSVRYQEFEFPFYEELGPSTLTRTLPDPDTTFASSTLEYSGNGTVSGRLFSVNDNQVPATGTGPSQGGSTAGCEPGDFAQAPAATSVVLIQRGTCDFVVKVNNATAKGYDAVVIFNEGNTPERSGLLTDVTLGAPVSVPVVGISYADGVTLYRNVQAGRTEVTVTTNTQSEVRETVNVLADSPRGKKDEVVVVGAHLDSVPAGPGINDNGSGSAGILEIAEQMAALGYNDRLQRRVRFAFWGAEENGLLGSEYYVEQLNDRQLARHYANLNFDMIGSPNYVRFVYDGDASDFPAPDGGIPPGSAQIEDVFTRYFASQGLASAPTEFSGRSDYGPFIAVGIPAGGLFSGAEGIKTPAEAAIYGGTAGIAYDPCYHQACDNIGNLSTKALNELGDAAAHATLTLALSRTGFFEDGSRVAARSAQKSKLTQKGHALVE